MGCGKLGNGEKTGYICVLYIYKKARMKADCGGYIFVLPSLAYVFTAERPGQFSVCYTLIPCLSSAPQSSSDRPTVKTQSTLVSANVIPVCSLV